MRRAPTAASVIAALAVSVPALAQGKSQQNKNKNQAPGAPPSRNELAAAAPAPAPTGATPLAWIDDASLIAPGTMTFSVSAMRWSGGGTSEVDVPIVDAAFGLAPRLQLAASVPRVVGSPDPAGAAGGVGTSFFSAKVGVYDNPTRAVKAAVAPTLQVLGEGVVASLQPGEGRVRWGLPVSAEISRGAARVYGGGGYFSPGLWFAGAALSGQASERVFVSAGFSRAWRYSSSPGVPMSERDRKEISGGVAYLMTPGITLFGSVGRTVATLIENGAGTSILGGASFAVAAAGR